MIKSIYTAIYKKIKPLTLISFVIFCFTASAADKAIIVFDASGSMWGQVEGQTKIAIAKKTLNQLVKNWDENKELGLMAYGHRRKGDCKDIEALVPVGKVNKARMISRVNKINPKGKTPISASLKQAANELKFTEDNATVILISDGKETCNADPCETAAELEKLGVNFTAHVIGFDVDIETSKQLQCIADNTGGKYFPADNAQQLNDALQKVVEQPNVLTIKAIDKKDNAIIHKTIEWKLINQDSEEVISLSGLGSGSEILIAGQQTNQSSDQTAQKIQPGKWLVSGTAGTYGGEAQVEIVGGENQLVKVVMAKKLAKVKIIAPDEAVTGTGIDISWEISKQDVKGKINLQKVDEKPNFHTKIYVYTQDKKEGNMRLPTEAGEYVLRFYDIKDRKTVLAEHPINLKAAEIIINAPDEAGTGTEIDISWVAPKDADAKINMQTADEKPQYHATPYFFTKKKKEASMRMPAEAGDYVLRWYNLADRKVVVEKPIKLNQEVVTINAPDEAVTGSEIDITWTAPKTSDAKLNLQKADEKPAYHSSPYFYTKKKSEDSMRMPSEAGDYVLRWYNISDRKVVTEKPIKLTEAQITINAPDEAGTGSEIDISWLAPKTANAKINLQKADEKPEFHTKVYLYTKNKTEAALRLPSEDGEYVLRWYNLSDRKAISERPIKLLAQKITITAPDEALAGSEIELSWDAPKGLDAFINIQPVDEKPNYNASRYIYTKKKTSSYMRVPSIAGDYMLRWYNRKDKKVVTERPIKLTKPEVTINAPDEAIAGTEMELSWQAPKDLNSFINLQLADEKPNYNARTYIYTNKKTSDYMRLPSVAGDYTLRWFTRGDKQIFAERPLKIKAAEIKINAPSEAKAGSEIEISWQAPKGLDAFINLQKAGGKPDYNAKTYFYIKKKTSHYMKMPDETGDYVLRWFNRNDREMMAETPIKIVSGE